MPEKMRDPGTMPKKIMKFGGDVGEGEEIRASSGEGSGQVPEKVGPGEYRKGGIQASTGNVRSRRVPKRWDLGKYQKCGIRASTGKVKSG